MTSCQYKDSEFWSDTVNIRHFIPRVERIMKRVEVDVERQRSHSLASLAFCLADEHPLMAHFVHCIEHSRTPQQSRKIFSTKDEVSSVSGHALGEWSRVVRSPLSHDDVDVEDDDNNQPVGAATAHDPWIHVEKDAGR